MDRKPFRRLQDRFVVLERNNVDTDQIIPARFLTATTRSGIGKGLFADWRYDEGGAPRPEFVLNWPEAAGAAILVAGDNFGCGSSREHAPWALLENGIRAVVSTAIADIFRINALKNHLLPITVEREFHDRLIKLGTGMLTVDVEQGTIALNDSTGCSFTIDAFARYCLLNGVDELGFLLEKLEAIEAYEERTSGGRV